MKTISRTWPVILTLTISCFLTSPLIAQKSWDGGGDGTTWNDPANWNPDGVPTATDDIDLTAAPASLAVPSGAVGRVLAANSGANTTLTGSNTLALSGDANNAAVVNGGTLTLDGLQVNGTGKDVIVGDTATGSTLNINSGAQLNNRHGMIGKSSASGGTVTVNGTGSQWNNTGNLYIGGNATTAGGTGILNVQNDGLVSVDGTTKIWGGGTLNLDGGSLTTGSFDNSQGTFNFNSGNLTIVGGTINSVIQIDSSSSGTTSTLTFDGANRNFTGWVIDIGRDNNGVFNLNNASTFTTLGTAVGRNSGSNGTLNIDGAGSVFTTEFGPGPSFGVGVGGTGQLNISNSGKLQVTGDASIGELAGGDGLANVSTNGVFSAANLYLGGTSTTDGGNASLLIYNGGYVQVGNFVGTDSGLSVGDSGSNGNLVVRNGAYIGSSGNTLIGGLFTAGTVTVTGQSSTLELEGGQMVLGEGGHGTLNVTDDAAVYSQRGYVGRDALGTGIATVDGSAWVNSESLYVGASGNGTLNVTGGGVVLNWQGFLGESAGSYGLATVDGPNSRWDNDNLFIGGNATAAGGTGILNVQNDGLVDVYGTTKIWGGGTLNLDGGSLTTGSFDNSQGTFNFNSGTLTIEGGTINSVIQIDSSSSGTTSTLTMDGANRNFSDWVIDVGQDNNGVFNLNNGSTFTTLGTAVGRNSGSNGTLNIDGSGSVFTTAFGPGPSFGVGVGGTGQLNISNSGKLQVAGDASIGELAGGDGTVNVSTNGVFEAANLYIGGTSAAGGGTGILNVQNDGSVSVAGTTRIWGDGTLNLDGGSLTTRIFFNNVGGTFNFNSGALTIDGGVIVGDDVIQVDSSSSGATSTLTMDNGAYVEYGNWVIDVGQDNNGILNLNNGSKFTTLGTAVGRNSGSSGTLNIDGSGSVFTTQADGPSFGVGVGGTGQLNISNSGSLRSLGDAFIGELDGSDGTVNVSTNGIFKTDNLYLGGTSSTDGGSANLTIDSDGYVQVGNGNDTVNVSGNSLLVSDTGANGTLVVRNGASIAINDADDPARIIVGRTSGSSGSVTVAGAGSSINGATWLDIGQAGNGTLNVTDGGFVSTRSSSYVGTISGSTGDVIVNGPGSRWENFNNLFVAHGGNGTLNVTDGGWVHNKNGFIGFRSGSTGEVTVNGAGSQWNNSEDLYVGYVIFDGNGTLNINSGGLVTVGGTTSVNSTSSVALDGGRFEFGTTDLTSFRRISGTSGSLKGDVEVSGIHNVAELFRNTSFELNEITVKNAGVLFGSEFLDIALKNQASGELRTFGSDFVRFANVGNTNSGEINIFGGVTEFANDLTNLSGGEINNFGGTFISGSLLNEESGFISGRGEFLVDGGLINDGVLAFSAGLSDFHGDINNSATGLIAIGGGSVTTFYDDVTMDAANMNLDIAENSTAVFFGSYNGGSDGMGDVHAFGDLRPGNSPDSVSFGGDLMMGSQTATFIELAGLGLGEFDQLNVAGDLSLNGLLNVSLIDGFMLDYNQNFLIADVNGSLFGQFSNFGEGDLVGSFNGVDLYITYGAGDGNDVGLFSAVPEPGSCAVLCGLMIGLGLRRRRS